MAFSKKKETLTTDSLPLVAIDLGGSSFKLMAAEVVDPTCDYSQLRILGANENTKYRCMKKGIIDNTSEASYMIRESMLLLGNRIGLDNMPTAFTVLGGKTMRCVTLTSRRAMGVETPISKLLLDNMRKECFAKIEKSAQEKAKMKADAKPLSAIDVRVESFRVDDEVLEEEPVLGMTARQEVLGQYSTFYALQEMTERTNGSFDRAGKSQEAVFARPIAQLEALANENDELLGVAIIDMGADTTTISVFKAGRFLTCKVWPQGGRNITMDIQMQGISMENAEKLKLKFGSAYEKKEDVKAIRIRPLKAEDEPVVIRTDFLSEIIVSRLDEIMAPIFGELKLFESEISKVYLTGGACKMRDIISYVQQHTSLPVEYGSHADWLTDDTPEQYFAPEYSATIGALLLGAKYRRRYPNQPIPGVKVMKDKKTTFLEKVAGLFDGQEEGY